MTKPFKEGDRVALNLGMLYWGKHLAAGTIGTIIEANKEKGYMVDFGVGKPCRITGTYIRKA